MKPYISGEFNIRNINPAQYKEVFFSDVEKDDRWFKIKVAFPEFDEKAMVMHEKSKDTYLVQAQTSEKASSYINDVMKEGMQDYRIVSNVETKIIDVFKH